MAVGRIRALLLVMLIPVGTAATSAPTPPPPQKVFSVYPAQENDTTLPGHFRFDLTAGTTVHDGMVVQNFSSNTITVDIYAADLVQSVGGGVNPTQKGDALTGVGAWISVAVPSVTLPPLTQTTVPFTVAVPVGITPANNAAAVVAAVDLTHGGSSNVQAREALIVQINVPGTARPAGTLSQLTESKDSTQTTKKFAVDLTNTGNVLLSQTGTAVVRDSSGNVVSRLPLVPGAGYAIPGGVLHLVSSEWNPPSSGSFTVQAEVPIAYDTTNGSKNAGTLLSNTLTYAYFDWRILAAGIVGGLIIIFVIWRVILGLLRRRKASAAERAEAERDARAKQEAAERLRRL